MVHTFFSHHITLVLCHLECVAAFLIHAAKASRSFIACINSLLLNITETTTENPSEISQNTTFLTLIPGVKPDSFYNDEVIGKFVITKKRRIGRNLLSYCVL